MHTKTTLRLLTLGTTLFAGIACADPLKVALVETLSGPSAATGQMFRAATRFQIERLNAEGGWNGEPIQLLEFDSQGTPAGASEKLKAAIGSGAQMIVQGASSVAAGQITEDVRKYNLRNKGKEVVFLNVGGEALELTGSKCHFYHFRFNGNAPIRVKTLVAAMKEAGTLGSKVYSMNQNYSWGLDMEQAITENAAAGGYQLVGKSLHDTQKVQDFSPYIARIQASGAETVLTGNWGNDLLLLMKASRSLATSRFSSASCQAMRRACVIPSAFNVSALRRVLSANWNRTAPARTVSRASGSVILLLKYIRITITATPISASTPMLQWKMNRMST